MEILVKLLDPRGKIPVRAKPDDAAYDLFALDAHDILPGQRKLVKTGIAIAIPQGYYGRVAERSGLALKAGLSVGGGVCDASYRGDIGVIAINLNQGGVEEVIQIKAGERVAQLLIERCYDAEWTVVDSLPESARGTNGFGSTS